MADLKITGLGAAGALDGSELVETVQGGVNVKTTTEDIAALAITREPNRTFVEALLFDKNEIFHIPFTQTAAINLTIAVGGLVDQASFMRFRMTADGINAVNFGEGFDFLYGINSGEILEAGTYEFYFLYINGSVSVNVPGRTSEQSSLVVLDEVDDFAAVADGETAIDLSWSNIPNNSGYLIEFSLTGTGGWTTLETTAADATSSTQTGLSPGDIRFYRIKTLGDGVSFTDSAFSTAISGQTEDSGDTDAPEFVFTPAAASVIWPVNRPIIVTSDKPIRNTDGSEITNFNVASRMTLKETNGAGADIGVTWTIDGTKQVITGTPTTIYGANQLVYVAINNVEDVNGNEVTVAESSTFTTTSHSYLNGITNRLIFGDILDALIALANTEFRLKLTVNLVLLTGQRILASKWYAFSNERSFRWYTDGADVFFGWAGTGAGNNQRFVQWTGAMSAGEHELELRYNGAIDTNDGLDRVTLLVDGITAGSKTLVASATTGSLADIANSTAQLAVGALVSVTGTALGGFYTEEAKDFIIESSAGTVDEINVAVIRLGTDSSGNSRNGTWV